MTSMTGEERFEGTWVQKHISFNHYDLWCVASRSGECASQRTPGAGGAVVFVGRQTDVERVAPRSANVVDKRLDMTPSMSGDHHPAHSYGFQRGELTFEKRHLGQDPEGRAAGAGTAVRR
jgi:hypothetical protein